MKLYTIYLGERRIDVTTKHDAWNTPASNAAIKHD